MRLSWLVVFAAAVGCHNHSTKKNADGGVDAPPDAEVCTPLTPPNCNPTMAPTTPAAGSATCNVLSQIGCASGQKCTWIHDSSSTGHIGCTPDGIVQDECACTYGANGATGYDDCAKGGICIGAGSMALCKQICDQNGGAPMCGSAFACGVYSGVFGPVGQPAAAGACDPRCDPLADNDFLATGHKPGCICRATEGCYGIPSSTVGVPTGFMCVVERNKSLVHRSACTTAAGCADSAGNIFLNGCAQGYLPLLLDMTGSMQVDCVAMCSPGNTYMGNPGTQFPTGKSPHTCTTTDARGTFNPATTTTNGDHCLYSWFFEVDLNTGNLVRSPTSDTVGFCVDHTKYYYDPASSMTFCTGPNNPAGCIAWPLCASLPLTAGSNQSKASDFGCIDSHTAGFPARPPSTGPHVLYHRVFSAPSL